MTTEDQGDLFVGEAAEPSGGASDAPAGQPAHVAKPLAARLRPRSLAEVVGQEHILRPGSLLPRLVAQNSFGSLLFYGPPGSGKTSIAEAIARETRSRFVRVNAVMSNVAELREILSAARRRPGEGTILFIDELHRFNKAQQDLLLPDIEEGNIRLIGATTHNPGFYVIPPLLSRSHLFRLEPLEVDAIVGVLKTALADEQRGLGARRCSAEERILADLARMCEGDLRRALNALEVLVLSLPEASAISTAELEVFARERRIRYDATRTSTTTRSPPSSRAAAAATRMRRCTGWRRCWRGARIRASSRGAWSSLRARMWGWPTRGRFRSPSPRTMPAILSGCPRRS